MTPLRVATVLFAVCVLGAASAGAQDADRLESLTDRLAEAVDEGYRLQRIEGDGRSSRLAVQLRRLRVQTRRLRADLAKGRSPEELRPVALTIRSLARDVTDEATERFATTSFSEATKRMQETADEIVSLATQRPLRRIAQETESHGVE